jgi:hypothetical protein
MTKIRFAAIFGVIILGIIAAAIVISGRLVPSDAPVAGSDENTFPKLTGTNLLLESVTVPDDLPGELRLIVVAYDRDQQIFVEKWLLPLEELNAQYPELAGYYLPLLPQSASDAALPIIGGMTVAASSDRDRARTVVVFTDVDAFNEILDIPGVDALQLFLLDESGSILWRGSGNYDPVTLELLESALNENRTDSQ